MGLMFLVLAFSGCTSIKEKLGIAFPAKEYVESVLKTVYLGEYESYQKYTGENEAAAKEHHDRYIEEEAAYFGQYLHIETLSEEGEARLKKVIEALYQQVRFEVQEPIVNKGGQLVEVVVYPVDFFGAAGEEIDTFIKNFSQDLNSGEYDALSEEEQKSKYEKELLAICEKYTEIPESGYQISVNLTIKERDGGYYQIVDGMEKLDEAVIQY